MALEIGKYGASPYRQPVPVPLSALEGLVASSTDQIQEKRPRPEVRAFFRRSGNRPIAIMSAFPGQSLLGSPPPAEQPSLRAPSTGSISRTLFSQFQTATHGNLSELQVSTTNVWLADALEELEQVDQEAAEEGFPLSNELSRGNARRILKELAREPYPAPTVYPTENGEIAILFQKRRAQAGVLILCEQDGSGACFSTIAGKKRRARYDDASDLPDAFVLSELGKLRLA